MKPTKILVALLSAAMLFPAMAAAQFFAKQKVVVWAVMDRNNDVKVAEGTKTQIRTSIVDAFVNSRNYEAFEANLDDVKSRVGQSMSPIAIAKAVKEMYGVDYVLFTTIKIMQHSTSYDNFQVHLSSDLFSAETQKSERMAYVDMRSDVNEIPAACAKLLSDLLGEQNAPARPAQSAHTGQSIVAQSAQSAQSYSPASRSGVEVVLGYLKVFPNELGTFSTKPTNAIAQINRQAMHGYDTWRLPTAEELALVKAQGLAGGGNYMTSSSASSGGIVLLVTDATETYAEKQQRKLAEEQQRQRGIVEGRGDNGIYQVGYYYNQNGNEGVVFEVTDGGRHGWIISAKGSLCNWLSARSWCANLGSRWMLPSVNQLRMIYGFKGKINAALKAKGYGALGESFHWSSEVYVEPNVAVAYGIAMNNGGFGNSRQEYDQYVRAVSAF